MTQRLFRYRVECDVYNIPDSILKDIDEQLQDYFNRDLWEYVRDLYNNITKMNYQYNPENDYFSIIYINDRFGVEKYMNVLVSLDLKDLLEQHKHIQKEILFENIFNYVLYCIIRDISSMFIDKFRANTITFNNID